MLKFNQLVDQNLQANLPFVAYHKPNDFEVKLITQNDQKLHKLTDLNNQSGFVFAPFNAEQTRVIFPTQATKTESFLQTEFKTNNTKASPIDESPVYRQAEEYRQLVQKAINSIKQSNLKKIVTSRAIHLPVEVPQISLLFQRLLHAYPEAMTYVWFHPKVGLWAGATPETLIKLSHNQLKTVALAGTRQVSELTTNDFTTKEYEEQDLVTQHILQSLAGCSSHIKAGELTREKAGTLVHLKTEITARLNPDSLGQLIEQLHPTPAICGLPTQEAKDFISTQENYERSYYTGYFGELNFKTNTIRSNRPQNIEHQVFKSVKNNAHLFVNLRCMSIQSGQSKIYVGGGITAQSDPESEWLETCNKAKTMLNVL